MTETAWDDSYDPKLRAHVQRAFVRTRRRLREQAPALARQIDGWWRSLTLGAPPQTYFMNREAFPMLLLPWWLEGQLTEKRDRTFDADLVTSTINGYYAVRLIDDLMDGDRPPPPAAIPALIPFQAEFLLAYQRHFPPGHPFWPAFTGGALASAEMAAADADLRLVDRDRFVAISGRKVTGAKLPIIALCHRYERLDLVEPWSTLVDRLGCWHQMANDMRGWNRDLDHGRATYFLTEAAAQTGDAGSVAEWVLTEGLVWGATQLDGWMSEVIVAARGLDCPPLLAYLDARQRAASEEWQALLPSLAVVQRLARAFEAPRLPRR